MSIFDIPDDDLVTVSKDNDLDALNDDDGFEDFIENNGETEDNLTESNGSVYKNGTDKKIEEIEEEKETDENGLNELSETQKQRSERNRLKALSLKKARLLAAHPYEDGNKKKPVNKEKKLVDSGGGFFIEEEDDPESLEKRDFVVSEPPPLLPPDRPNCQDCDKEFAESWLLKTFEHPVCDDCKNTDKDGPHELITKTDAKKEFLLKDTDFEKGERGETDLNFILRKNPHNARWGDMKLFLRLQVESRAMKIWGTEEALEAEHEAREEARVMAKTKKYNKKMKELRKVARSSLFTKDISSHTHTYGEEVYDDDKDEYRKTCDQCGHVHTYEKM